MSNKILNNILGILLHVMVYFTKIITFVSHEFKKTTT